MAIKLDRLQARARRRMFLQTRRELLTVFRNTDGLKRVANISKEDWQRAAQKDMEEGQADEELGRKGNGSI